MPQPSRSIAARIWIVVLLVAAGLVGYVLYSVRPKIKTATMDEVRAVLPKELLAVAPRDAAAQDRYRRLIGLIPKVSTTDLKQIQVSPTVPASQLYTNVCAFWKARPKLKNDITGLLNQGGIEAPIRNAESPAEYTPISDMRNFVKVISASALAYAAHKEFSESTEMLLMAQSLSIRLENAGGALITYLSAISMDSVVEKALVAIASLSDYPTGDCRRLLGKCAPASPTDEHLASALLVEFQQYTLPMLPNPMKPRLFGNASAGNNAEPIVGTYEPIETARLCARLVLVELANAKRPYSKRNTAAGDIARADASSLPSEGSNNEEPGLGKSWNTLRYRFQMDTMHNTIGRELAGFGLFGDGALQGSCRFRAMRSAERVLLAARLYREVHGGSLPPTTEGFEPYIGAWPTDPFNGAPMIYKPQAQLVYSVGRNFLDDGGQIGVAGSEGPDVGVSLKVVHTP